MSDKLGHTDPSLAIPPSAHVFSKSRFSMLTPEVWEGCQKLYSNKGIDHVVLFGIESQVCILQTTLELLEKGVGVTVVQDGVSSINQGEICIALDRLKQAGAFVSTSESVLFQIMQDASHPGFKQIQGLLKETKDSSVVKAAEILQVPIIVTGAAIVVVKLVIDQLLEQLPEKLGSIDNRIPLPEANCFKYSKATFSMLTPEVVEKVEELKLDHVVLFGIESHVCVLQTALDLLDRGIGVTVIQDGVSSCNKGEIGIALQVRRLFR
ncbi:UNVERIFIED_CONTAM: Isochorismatase domain-containing protein 1 [Siphonaria sp. JEL0065]|nr:Isochorismatase domain-containing protein 1 [Siphonaria sp. JEL0065]